MPSERRLTITDVITVLNHCGYVPLWELDGVIAFQPAYTTFVLNEHVPVTVSARRPIPEDVLRATLSEQGLHLPAVDAAIEQL